MKKWWMLDVKNINKRQVFQYGSKGKVSGGRGMKSELFKYFERICILVESKYFNQSKSFKDSLGYLCELMDFDKIPWSYQNKILNFWNNWEVNYKLCLSMSYRRLFDEVILK